VGRVARDLPRKRSRHVTCLKGPCDGSKYGEIPLASSRPFGSSSSSAEPTSKKSGAETTISPLFSNLVSGPPTQFGFGKIANLTESSVIGSSGETVTLTTMAAAPVEQEDDRYRRKPGMEVGNYLRQICKQRSSFVPLTVDYRQRHHAVGKIPTNAGRSDNKRPTNAETLASRAIDRALRPLLKSSNDSIHLSCSVQSCPVDVQKGGYPVALALNSAAVALGERLEESVACVYLSLTEDGTVVIDPSIADDKAIGGLLYAGTRDKVVMMEFSGILDEPRLMDLISLAHGCIQPLLDIQEGTGNTMKEQKKNDSMLFDEDSLRIDLGLPKIESNVIVDDNSESKGAEDQQAAERTFQEALSFCSERLSTASLKLFGHTSTSEDGAETTNPAKEKPRIHSNGDGPLLSKSHRGRRENVFRGAVVSVLHEFISQTATKDDRSFLQDNPSLVDDLADAIHSELLQEGLNVAAIEHKSRADGRAQGTLFGCTTIRPISLEVPALPNVVHGSSLFTRGETQVLCTATLGPPTDGIPLNDPFRRNKEEVLPDARLSDELPVGSLRYLKTQEYLESDLNSRKVRADREQTGDSGTLKERQRAFLQYDFPAFSKGEIQSGPKGGNRREIGHGALAEKAILPVLPSASEFPYAIRITSEVTSSNGSSSMASVCGATLALLDAGVPIKAPVVGLSVGLAKRRGEDERYQLMLDITGTEDHFGGMDFKIAGTYDEVTAVHLDVHEPLPHTIIFDALRLAKDSRGVLLDEMQTQAALSSSWIIRNYKPRPELKPSAPRVEVVRFDPMRKKDLLGPGGTVIRQMEDRFNVSLDLTQEGQCLLFGQDREMVRKARVAVMDLVSDVEVGEIYQGTIIEIRDFGVIIELLRNKEGLCHVSEMAKRDVIRAHPEGTIGLINSLVQVGQKLDVECTAVDPVMGTIRLRPANRDNFQLRVS
jgi:polyribonucleotide nucleotidyltransferase